MRGAKRKYHFIPLPNELQSLFDSVRRKIQSTSNGRQASEPVAGFQHFLKIQQQLELVHGSADPDISPKEITELGEFGLELIKQLCEFARREHILEAHSTLAGIAIGVTDWIMINHGRIVVLEPVVDAIAATANSTSNPGTLSHMTDFMGQVATNCSDRIKYDLDLDNPLRPWRLLQINRGITATRSHNPDTMTRVFDDLVAAIPYDAPEFFTEGMREMALKNYPDFIKNVMHEYYEKHSHPRSH